jgi:hypothetical protein
VSERVILAMVRSGREVSQPQQAVNDAAPPPPASDPQVIVIDHHDAPEIREVPVAVPVYIPVATRAVHTRTLDGSANGIPISSDRWIAEHMPGQVPAVRKTEPVYWGFGGKLRPDAWKPAPDPAVSKKQN